MGLVASLAACAPRALTITYIGHSAFEMSDGRTTLLVDYPYEPGASGYMTYDSATVRPVGRVAALFTHRHGDHFSLAPLLRESWQVVGPRDLTALLPPERVVPPRDTIRVGDFSITALPEGGHDVEHVAYLIGWRGRRLYHSGDIRDPAGLQAMRGLDVAMVGEVLLCWMAAQRGARVDTRHLIAHHYFAGHSRGCLGARAVAQGERLVLTPAP